MSNLTTIEFDVLIDVIQDISNRIAGVDNLHADDYLKDASKEIIEEVKAKNPHVQEKIDALTEQDKDALIWDAISLVLINSYAYDHIAKSIE